MIDAGIAAAEVKVKKICVCDGCGARELSSSQSSISIGSMPEGELGSMVELFLKTARAVAPVGWAQYGHGNYKCDKCKT